MGARNKKNKRNQKKRSRAAKKRRAQSAFPEGAKLVVPRAGETKMSEVLWEFLEPYAEHWQTEEELNKLLIVGQIAWNAALFSGRKREDFIQDMLRAAPADVRQEMRSIL